MKYTDPSPNNHPETNWRILGELELTSDTETGGMLGAWLTKILNPLELHADFLSKVTKSAQDATIHAITSEHVRKKSEHIHLRVFTLQKNATNLHKGQTWGFFRIEKMGTSPENGNPYDHSIEFYLYLEG